jgi:hypothetical protein
VVAPTFGCALERRDHTPQSFGLVNEVYLRLIAEAHRNGAVGYEFDACLALGEIELKAGLLRPGRPHPAAAKRRKQARIRLYLPIAGKASLALSLATTRFTS